MNISQKPRFDRDESPCNFTVVTGYWNVLEFWVVEVSPKKFFLVVIFSANLKIYFFAPNHCSGDDVYNMTVFRTHRSIGPEKKQNATHMADFIGHFWLKTCQQALLSVQLSSGGSGRPFFSFLQMPFFVPKDFRRERFDLVEFCLGNCCLVNLMPVDHNFCSSFSNKSFLAAETEKISTLPSKKFQKLCSFSKIYSVFHRKVMKFKDY